MDTSPINLTDIIPEKLSQSTVNNYSAAMDTTQRKHIIAEELGEKLIKAAGQSTSKSFATICRVPQELRKLNESAYTPRFISIGPLHSKDDDRHHLKQLEQNIKMSYVSTLFYKTSCGSEEEDTVRGMLKECLEDMENSIEDAKKHYAEEVHALNAEMLVMDGCFILELLHMDYFSKKVKPSAESIDPIFHYPLRLVYVKYDLLLLENQLPYFVLEKLFSRTLGRISGHPPLRECVLSYFHKMLRIGFKCSNKSNPVDCCLPNCCRPSDCVVSLDRHSRKPEKYHHILHLLSDHYGPDHGEYKEKEVIGGELKEMHSASDLDYAGVKFIARTGGEELFNVEFKPPLWCSRRARFEIPSLRLDDSTEALLRNLIAFEQCCPRVFPHFTSYAFLMDRLINTEKDVEVLEKAGVIRHYLGTRESVSHLFNGLCKEVSLNTRRDFYFAQTCNDAAEYSQRSWCSRAVPATTAYVIRTYSANPWTFSAFVVAFISFGIGVTNFIRSFL